MRQRIATTTLYRLGRRGAKTPGNAKLGIMKPSARLAAVVCGILCVGFASVSWVAASGKSATYDEPLHVATAWLNLWRGDFRLSPDVPPLWEYWIGLPLGKDAMT